MRALAGFTLLYLGVAWYVEQMVSHALQPLHLSASILIVLTIFLILANFQDPPFFQFFRYIPQV